MSGYTKWQPGDEERIIKAIKELKAEADKKNAEAA
jgi:hypothetical protein